MLGVAPLPRNTMAQPVHAMALDTKVGILLPAGTHPADDSVIDLTLSDERGQSVEAAKPWWYTRTVGRSPLDRMDVICIDDDGGVHIHDDGNGDDDRDRDEDCLIIDLARSEVSDDCLGSSSQAIVMQAAGMTSNNHSQNQNRIRNYSHGQITTTKTSSARLGHWNHGGKSPLRPQCPVVGLLHEYEDLYVGATESSSDDASEEYEEDEEDDDDEELDDEGTADTGSRAELNGGTQRPRVKPVPPPRALPPTISDLQERVLQDVAQLTARRPWVFVYRCLELPFESNPRTDRFGCLFARWDAFWLRHGRAVWERLFWAPLLAHTLEYRQRRYRQRAASVAFRALASDLHHAFDKALERVVAGQRVHAGWWYRPPRPLALRSLLRQDARLYELHMSRFRERWPLGHRYTKSLDVARWCLPASEPQHRPVNGTG